jgi:uncharacterized MnhB-related membrane protein
MKPARYSDRRGLTAIDGANALIAILVLVQMWLLSAAVEAALAGAGRATLPAVIASGALTAVCAGLYRFVSRIDREMRG